MFMKIFLCLRLTFATKESKDALACLVVMIPSFEVRTLLKQKLGSAQCL